jgi:hypothetical protein
MIGLLQNWFDKEPKYFTALLTLAVSWVMTLSTEASPTGAYTAVGSPPFLI